jgi:hypothetical protein
MEFWIGAFGPSWPSRLEMSRDSGTSHSTDWKSNAVGKKARSQIARCNEFVRETKFRELFIIGDWCCRDSVLNPCS